jgi:acetyl-CoA acetyltransferase family protein
MGCTAENIVERSSISREDQDEFALNSHRKALSAQENGWFDLEIIPVEIMERKKQWTLSTDEGPRADTNLEKLGRLKAAFRAGGSVTAGNSSTLNDGASALIIASEDYAKRHNLPIRARIVAGASAGVDPTVMGLGPIPATRKALKSANWDINDVDVWELNEAFAAQSLGVIRELGVAEDLVNLNGGAIALGHPLGCSGARILTTLLHIMERTDKPRGAATLCVGVGQGVTTLIERDTTS